MQYTPLMEFGALPERRWSLQACRTHLSTLWHTSNDLLFFLSPVRRRRLRIVLPAALSILTTVDMYSGASTWTLACEIVSTVAVSALFSQAESTLCPDMGYAVLQVATLGVYLWQDPASAPNTGDTFVYIALMHSTIGMHWVANLVIVLAQSLVVYFMCPSILWAAPLALGAVLMGFWSDIDCASVYKELHGEQEAVQLLLKGAGNGACTLSTNDGVITSATPQFESTMARSSVEGMRFADLLLDSDVEKMEELLEQAAGQARVAGHTRTAEPILVGCRTPRFDIDAKLIPYNGSATRISFCMQVQGERRFRQLDRGVAGMASISEPSAFPVHNGSTSSLSYSAATRTGTATIPQIAERETQTERRERLPELPPWMFARPMVRDGSASEAGSERGAVRNPGRIVIRRRTRRQRRVPANLFFMFGNRPFLPGFEITNEEGMERSILRLLRHWNAPMVLPGEACCQHHALCHLISIAARRFIDEGDCMPQYRPFDSWQCELCLCMNQEGADACEMCTMARPTSTTTTDSEPDAAPAQPEPNVAPVEAFVRPGLIAL